MHVWRRAVGALGFGLALGLLLLALHLLAAALTAAHLRQVATERLATLQAGAPLWQWQPRAPDDLIAGRAFGAAGLTAAPSGVRAVSRDGSPYQLGLRLAQPIDLAHWPLLMVRGHASAPGRLGLIRQTADQPACVAPDVAALPAGAISIRLDLRDLPWRSAGGDCPAPGIADMLRLQPHLPAGASLQLHSIALVRAPDAAPALSDRAWTVPDDPAAMAAWIAAHPSLPAAPLLRLPANASAETQLALRDRLLRERPGALVTVGDGPAHPVPDGRIRFVAMWGALALYLAGLAWLGLRSPRGPAQGWLELAAIMLGPLWLIAGLQWGAPQPRPAALAFAAALAYAGGREWRTPRDWRWWGGLRASALALAPLPLVLALMVWWGQAWHLPRLPGAAMYLLWAALQQWLLLAVVLRRLQTLVPWPALAVLLTASGFALLHAPNGVLMQLCLIAECWWAWCFLRTRTLLPIALAHAACALLVQAGLVGGVLRSMEVSARFFV